MTNTFLQPEDVNRLLAEKIVYIDSLEKRIKELEESLHVEMDANEHLNGLNVELKGRLREAGQEMKVRIHPSSLKNLQKLNAEKQQKINQLREAIDMALKIIPDDRVRAPYISTIRNVYANVL